MKKLLPLLLLTACAVRPQVVTPSESPEAGIGPNAIAAYGLSWASQGCELHATQGQKFADVDAAKQAAAEYVQASAQAKGLQYLPGSIAIVTEPDKEGKITASLVFVLCPPGAQPPGVSK